MFAGSGFAPPPWPIRIWVVALARNLLTPLVVCTRSSPAAREQRERVA